MLSPYQLYYGEESMVCAMRTEVLPCIVLLRATRRCWQKSYLVERADKHEWVSAKQLFESTCIEKLWKSCTGECSDQNQGKRWLWMYARRQPTRLHMFWWPWPIFKVTGIKKFFLPFPVWMQVDWMFPLLGFVDLPNDFSGNCFLLVPWLGFGG